MINQAVLQYKAGLISLVELKKVLDFVNMGSDNRYIKLSDLI